MARREGVSAWRLTCYGLITLPLAVAGLPIAIYVAPLYTEHLGLGLTVVGLVLMATRLLDIFVDPLVARLSDATSSPLGRRVPWILLGLPVMMAGTWWTFLPGPEASAWTLFGALAVFYLGWALITVPYGAWGAELSEDYHQRSRIAGARELWSVIGLLFAVTFPLFIRSPDLDRIPVAADREMAAMAGDVAALGWAAIVLLPVSAVFLFVFVPRPGARKGSTGRGKGFVRDLVGNKPFLLLLAATFFASLASGMNQTTVVLYYRYRADIGDAADLMIFAFFAAAVVGAFFWVWLGRFIPKHKVLAWSSLLSLAFSLAIIAVPSGSLIGFTIIQFGAGVAYAGPLILGASMAADVIDLDWLRSGVQRSAMFIAVWGIGKKLSEALGVGIALPLMDAMGFSADTAAANASQWSLITVNVILPACFALIAIPFILAYPITEHRQRVIRRAIERRVGREQAQSACVDEVSDANLVSRGP